MKLVPNSVSSTLARSILKTKKNSPHILFIGGVAGIIGTVILSSRATLKLSPVLDEIKEDFDGVTNMGGYDEADIKKYTETEYRKDVAYVYLKGAVKVGKLYGPSIILGGASIAMLTKSHTTLTKRNAALTATLATVMEAYEAYRARVREEIGESRELELYQDITKQTVEIDGKKKSIETRTGKHSPYARIFDEYNEKWEAGWTSEYVRNFLMCQQNYANQKLQANGYFMLNDAYDALGMERSSSGQIVGWVKNNPEGDGYIDFGIWEGMNERTPGNWEPAIWLDFNVDGPVFKLLDRI